MRMQTCSGLDSLRLVASSWTAIILWAGFFFNNGDLVECKSKLLIWKVLAFK